MLEWILSLPAGETRDAAALALERFELAAADASAPNEGAEELVRRLRAAGPRGRRAHAQRAERGRAGAAPLRPRSRVDDFDVVVTRDDGDIAPKPAPDGVLHAAAAMGVPAEETLVVGDFLLDMRAGRAAGAVTAYLAQPRRARRRRGGRAATRPTATSSSAASPSSRTSSGSACRSRPASCPTTCWPAFLAGVRRRRPGRARARRGSARTSPRSTSAAPSSWSRTATPSRSAARTSERAAVARQRQRHRGRRAPSRAGCSRRCCCPPGTTPSQALALLHELALRPPRAGRHARRRPHRGHGRRDPAASSRSRRSGHCGRAELKDKRSARTGDRVLLTKALAMEGTALLAEELGERLRALGMSDAELGRLPRAAGAGEHPAGGAPRPRRAGRARHARRHRGRPGDRAPGAGRGHRPRRPSSTATACRSRPRRGASAHCWRPTPSG